ncbi:MAG TPA: site-2 protease family protein [Vicinamibacterales bacterium]|nr:site-2 protease family protein [Vicinamibacterales bacterium]
MDLTASLIGFAIVIVALTIHEAAHAWTADQLGDPTARMLGRVSLNPVVHIDPIGTLLLPLVAMVSGLPIIGWAKPVPVNIGRLRHHRRDFMIVAAAGPISNFLQAVVIAVVHRALFESFDPDRFPAILRMAVETNLLLAFFNLIPIPPLDGGNVLAGLVPEGAAQVLDQVRQFGFIALYALMLSGVLSQIILPPTDFCLRLLLL